MKAMVLAAGRDLLRAGVLHLHILQSAGRLVVGFTAGAAAAVGAGILIGRSKRLERVAAPLLDMIGPIPPFALLPMFIMYLLSDVGSVMGGWVSSRLIQRGRTPNFARKVTLLLSGCMVLPLLFAGLVALRGPRTRRSAMAVLPFLAVPAIYGSIAFAVGSPGEMGLHFGMDISRYYEPKTPAKSEV